MFFAHRARTSIALGAASATVITALVLSPTRRPETASPCVQLQSGIVTARLSRCGVGMSMSQAAKGQKFRALHEAPGAFVIPNPWDAGSARLLSALGFPALATSSDA